MAERDDSALPSTARAEVEIKKIPALSFSDWMLPKRTESEWYGSALMPVRKSIFILRGGRVPAAMGY
jgi:hypothetical protein